MTNDFKGKIGRTFDDSTPWWPPLTTPPEGSPNILIVLLDEINVGSKKKDQSYARLTITGKNQAHLDDKLYLEFHLGELDFFQ